MSKHKLNIFLPAAGLGERLRPVTNYLPKPLLPILGKPIIETILEKLTAACDGRIGINLHWKPELIRSWAGASPWKDRVTFFPEDPILGTGGALKNAETFLSAGPFIAHNSDILLEMDFSRLVEHHLSSGNMATLVCHRLQDLSNVVIDRDGQVLDVENPGASRPDPSSRADRVAYTGVAVYAPGILQFLPQGVSHATVAWIAASKAGHRVRIYDVTGAYWNDVGNPATYVRAVLDTLLRGGETMYGAPLARAGNLDADGYVVIEAGSEVADGARLRNCIVLPGARVTGSHENRIIGPDYEIALPEADMQPAIRAAEKERVSLADPLLAHYFSSGIVGNHPARWSDAILIGLGGSDRRYYRVRNDGMTAVLMECRHDDPDFERHIVYTRFFASHGVPVPDLLAHDDGRKRALFEDLGDLSLYAWLRLPRPERAIESLYRSVLDILVRLHGPATGHVNECPLLQARLFDYDHLRWETGYFLERFVSGLRGMAANNRPALDDELHRLAQTVDGMPKGVIHRDFQSQNLMIHGGSPRVIDFQGARMAPPAYDAASLLWDPYHRLDDGLRDRLLAYYVGEMKRHAGGRFNDEVFLRSLLPCRLQRHLQALGAYGFLSRVKGKNYFLKHVPEALRLLREETEAARQEYPELHRLVRDLA